VIELIEFNHSGLFGVVALPYHPPGFLCKMVLNSVYMVDIRRNLRIFHIFPLGYF
jgi:hypothetical protein